MNVPVKPAELVEQYIRLRDGKKAAEEKFGEWLKTNFSDQMAAMEASLLDILNKSGLDSLSGPSGTAYKKLSTSVTVADAREFRRHVIGSENWDLVQWRVSPAVVNEMVEKGEPLPPGVNRTAIYTVQIRRK